LPNWTIGAQQKTITLSRGSGMKKSFLFSAIIIVILLTHNVTLGEDFIKVGLIDIQRCLEESKEGQKVLGLLKKKKDVLQRQLDTKQKKLLELRKELEKQSMMLTMNAQEDKRRIIERKTRELEYFFKDLNEDMRKAQEKEKKRMLKELGKVIEKVGSEENFTLIIEKRAGGLLYWADSIDITKKVIRAYEQMKEEGKE
jgi:outer membrane protein